MAESSTNNQTSEGDKPVSNTDSVSAKVICDEEDEVANQNTLELENNEENTDYLNASATEDVRDNIEIVQSQEVTTVIVVTNEDDVQSVSDVSTTTGNAEEPSRYTEREANEHLSVPESNSNSATGKSSKTSINHDAKTKPPLPGHMRLHQYFCPYNGHWQFYEDLNVDECLICENVRIQPHTPRNTTECIFNRVRHETLSNDPDGGVTPVRSMSSPSRVSDESLGRVPNFEALQTINFPPVQEWISNSSFSVQPTPMPSPMPSPMPRQRAFPVQQQELTPLQQKYKNMTTRSLTITNTGLFRSPNLSEPRGVAIDPRNGNIYVVDTGNNRVVLFHPDGSSIRAVGHSHGHSDHGHRNGQFYNPHSIVVSDRDEIIVTDEWNHRVQIFKINVNGNHIHHILSFGKIGQNNGEFINPKGIAYMNGQIYVCDETRIQIFSYDGEFINTYMSAYLISSPTAIAKGIHNTCLVVDFSCERVNELNEDGRRLNLFKIARPGVPSNIGMAVDEEGNVLIANPVGHTLDVYTRSGIKVCSINDCERPLQNVCDVALMRTGTIVVASGNEIVIFKLPVN